MTRWLDRLLLVAIAVATWHKIHWSIGGDVTLDDLATTAFLGLFTLDRVQRRSFSLPRVAVVLLGFLCALEAVHLAGFFALQSDVAVGQYAKGMIKFALHFALLICGVTHLVRRGERLLERSLFALVGGIGLNCVYGVAQLLAQVGAGVNLDKALIGPLTFGQGSQGGINVFGQVTAANGVGALATSGVYRVNALALDPNHLGIMLVVPLMIVLPFALREGLRGRRGLTLWGLLAFFLVLQVLALSRSGFLGDAVGAVVLAWPLRRQLLRPRFVVPVVATLGIGVLTVTTSAYARQIFEARFTLSDRSAQQHFQFFDLVRPVINDHPLFGLGLNTFSVYYEFLTGKTNWGPHSYFISVLDETGIFGLLVICALLAWVFLRLETLRRAARVLRTRSSEGRNDATLLATGLGAAIAGTIAANIFYLTMIFPYFYALMLVTVAASAIAVNRARA